MSSRVNALLMRCLGADKSGGYQPIGFESRLEVTLAEADQDERSLILKVLNMAWIPGSWMQASFADEMRVYERVIAKEHSELEPMVVRALANRWSYGWR